MKKYYYPFILVLLLFASSCNDDLEENPVGVLAPESFFTNKSDALASVMGTYSYFATYDDLGNNYIIVTELPTAMMGYGNTSQDIMDLSDFTETPANSKMAQIWSNMYKIISATNNAIDGIPGIQNMSEEEKNALIAEARAVRAFNYFRLVRFFGAVPYIDHFITDPSTVEDIERTPASEVMNHIIDDLDFAKANLPDKYAGGIRSRVSRGTAYTMLADVYLYQGNYQKAAENAQYVINHASDFGYGLVDDFKDIFDQALGDVKEHIWTIDFNSTVSSYPVCYDQMAALQSVRGSDYGGWSTIVSNIGTYNSFDDRDYRKKVTFRTEAPFNGVMKNYTEFPIPHVHVDKWYGSLVGTAQESGKYTDLNIPLYRYAEVLLIAAESLNEVNGGPGSDAYNYINQVRARARLYDGVETDYPADLQPGMSQEEFRNAVMEERRVELAFEFKRWFDIKRRHLITTNYGPGSAEPHPNVKEYNELYPIPQPEIDKNPNLTQNQGYN